MRNRCFGAHYGASDPSVIRQAVNLRDVWVYPGAPHGLAQVAAYKDTFNADLLSFLRA